MLLKKCLNYEFDNNVIIVHGQNIAAMEVVFTETNSHYTVQIFKFSYFCTMSCNKYYLFLDSMCAILYQFQFFVIMGIAQFRAKTMTLY